MILQFLLIASVQFRNISFLNSPAFRFTNAFKFLYFHFIELAFFEDVLNPNSLDECISELELNSVEAYLFENTYFIACGFYLSFYILILIHMRYEKFALPLRSKVLDSDPWQPHDVQRVEGSDNLVMNILYSVQNTL